MHTKERIKLILLLSPMLVMAHGGLLCASGRDIVLSGVHEAALDLPRIYFLIQRDRGGEPLPAGGTFEANYAFLDTGASGVVLSRETAEAMHITLEPDARFVDIGIGGPEYFNVSEMLYLRVAGCEEQQPENPGIYEMIGRGRFQVRRDNAGLLSEPLDIIGMPAMFNRVIVLDSAATNSLEYFAADIRRADDPDIPATDFEIQLKLRNCSNPRNPENIPPLPVLARNPVIDNVVAQRAGYSCRGQWLLDTGATTSLISVKMAARLGLTDESGKPLRKPDFVLPMGGIGNIVQVPGFEIDQLVLPTVSGRNLVFKGARIGVHDIEFYDETLKKPAVLDGVFGSNFLCASAEMVGLLPGDVSETAFDKIVIDFKNLTLGFRLRRASGH